MVDKEKDSDQETDAPKINLVLGVVSLQYEKECVDSLMGVIHSQMCTGYICASATLLPFGRNLIVRQFLEKVPDFTHLIFIDDDMCNFGPQHIHELVMTDKPIISALVTSRHPRYEIVAVFEKSDPDTIKKNIEDKDILKSSHVGMAFTVIKREVFDATSEDTPEGKVWFTTDRSPRDGFENEIEKFIEEQKEKRKDEGLVVNDQVVFSFEDSLRDAILLGQTSHIGSSMLGEDVAFCERATELGFQAYVHCGVAVGHISKTPRDFRDTFIHAQQIARPRIITSI